MDILARLNIFDCGIVILLLWAAIDGYRKGLLHGLVNLVALVLALVCGIMYNSQIAEYLEQQFGLYSMLVERVGETVHLLVSSHLPQGGEFALDLPSQIGQLPLPAATIDFLTEQLGIVPENLIGRLSEGISTSIATPLANLILSAAILCLAFLLFNLLAKLVNWLLRRVFRVTKSGLDSFAGLVFSIIRTAMGIALLLNFLAPLLSGYPATRLALDIQSSALVEPFLGLCYKIIGGSIDLWQHLTPL